MNSLAEYRPTDRRLFTYYLRQKVMGAPLRPGLIEDCDLYSREPWKIFNTDSEQTFYVFTTLRKNKSRVFRTAGSGTWKEQHATKIINKRGELIGYKKSFKFRGGLSAASGRWIMNEFSIYDERCKCVLCKIKYYGDKKKSKDKEIVILDDVLVQFEDENRQARRACLLHDSGDRTSDFAVALPSVDGAQTATAQAISTQAISSGVPNAEQLQMSMGGAPALHLDNDDLPFLGSSGDAIADSTMQESSEEFMEWMMTLDSVESRSVAPRPDIGDLTSLAFGSNTTLNSSFGCNRAFDDSPYTDQWIDEWINDLINMDINPVVNATAMLESTLGTSDNQMGGPTSLHPQRNVAESQEQEVPVTLAWADQFFHV